MTSTALRRITLTADLVLNIMKSMNINQEASKVQSGKFQSILKKLDGYKEQYEDQNYMKTLSPPEQQTLVKNAQMYSQVAQKLQKEIEYLDMSKHSVPFSNSLYHLEYFIQLSSFIQETEIHDDGKIAYQDLKHIKQKNFYNLNYITQVKQIATELDSLVASLKKEVNSTSTTNSLTLDGMLQNLYTSLAVARVWVKNEIDRVNREPIPEPVDIEIPKEFVPELPKTPEEVKETKEEV